MEPSPFNSTTLAARARAIAVPALVCVLFLAVDWANRFPFAFPDLINYREGFQSGWYVFSILNLDLLDLLLSEAGWVYGFDYLWQQTGNIFVAFAIVSATAVVLLVFYIYSRTRSLIACLFVFNPAFVHLTVEQLRSGLASGLFYVAVTLRSELIRAGLFVAAISLHTSFLLFTAFYYAFRVAQRQGLIARLNGNYFLSMIALFVAAAVISFFRDAVLEGIGDERAYIDIDQTSGILLALGWGTFLLSYFFLRKDRQAPFELYFFALNVFLLVSSIFTQSYGSRFVAIGVPALAALSVHMTSRARTLFYLHYFAFSLVYFWIWSSQ